MIATGGTIAWHSGLQRMLTGAELASSAGLASVDVVDVNAAPSWDLSVPDMEDIAGAVRTAIDEGADAVVVAHGTDTMEETAWLTELTLGGARRRRASVVFTGAMRFADHPAADGPSNLAAAVGQARRTAGRGLGVQIWLAGRSHAARWVRKIDASALDAFDSGGRPGSAPPPPAIHPRLNHAVTLLKVGALSRPLLPTDQAGVVLEGTGAAHVPSALHAAIEGLIGRGIPVVLATRCRDVERAGVDSPLLHAGDLTAEKAAIALMAALGNCEHITALGALWSELLNAGKAP
jgi:L-asparaginase